MAGAGFDAEMIKQADGGLKDRLGRVAYLYTGAKSIAVSRVRAKVRVDGERFHAGKVSCVLVGNIGKILGGIEVFPGARSDDGQLELGVVTASDPLQWTRVFARIAAGSTPRSPFVRLTGGKRFNVKFDRPVRYELDGGDRKPAKKLRIKVHPSSVTICVPAESALHKPGIVRLTRLPCSLAGTGARISTRRRGPAPGRPDDLLGEDRAADRHLDRVKQWVLHALPVTTPPASQPGCSRWSAAASTAAWRSRSPACCSSPGWPASQSVLQVVEVGRTELGLKRDDLLTHASSMPPFPSLRQDIAHYADDLASRAVKLG